MPWSNRMVVRALSSRSRKSTRTVQIKPPTSLHPLNCNVSGCARSAMRKWIVTSVSMSSPSLADVNQKNKYVVVKSCKERQSNLFIRLDCFGLAPRNDIKDNYGSIYNTYLPRHAFAGQRY